MSRFERWSIDDLGVLAVAGAIVVGLLALAIWLVSLAISAADCEFRPQTERCTLLAERSLQREPFLRVKP